MAKSKFIVVSNRLPVTVSKENGKLKFSPSSGGLATAMSSLKTGDKATWIGWPGIESEDLTSNDKKAIVKKLKEFDCIPVFLEKEQIANFYEGFSNEGIWPLFHYFQGLSQFDEENWRHYREVNATFAVEVIENASSDATIWVHDYHLMLMPKMLRTKLPKSSIGFFLHIPFPSFEVFRTLPNRKEVLEGMLGADLIGFHIYDYVRHFASSVLRTLGSDSRNGSVFYGDRVVKADAFPIGIDYKRFQKAVASTVVKKEIKKLEDHYGNKKLILSVDRLDYSKGIAKRLVAFEKFLGDNPQHHGKVTMVVIAVPSRTEVRAYQQLRDIIEQAVSRINGTYAKSDWVPVAYQFQNLSFNKLVALYAKAEIALVTPLRDGMNLVAKEYIASKQNRTGVLILSELTGAVDELSESLIVNPNDINGIVSAINYGLSMPAQEKRSRIESMQKRIALYDVHRWAEDFLQQLKKAEHRSSAGALRLIDSESQEQLINQFASSKKRLFILDYDGTLTPFVKSPEAEDATPTKSLLSLLKSLSLNPNNDVYIISGRPKKALQEWFGDLNIGLIAEHGYWIKHKGKWSRQSIDTKSFKDLAKGIMKTYEERTPGAELEEKNSSLVWHFRKVPPELAYVRSVSLSHDLRDILKHSNAGVFNGKKIVEVKPKSINKGSIANQIIKRENYGFVLCGGDDYTDEDMFRNLPNETKINTVKVGLGETDADYQVKDVKHMLELLKAFREA